MTTTEAMSRHAGPIAIVAGLLFAALDLGRLPIIAAEDARGPADPLLVALNAGNFFAFCGADGGVDRAARPPGPAGGCVRDDRVRCRCGRHDDDGGRHVFDGFASPWLAEVAPRCRRSSARRRPGDWRPGELRPDGAGLVLYGLATLRARVFPMLARSDCGHGPDRVRFSIRPTACARAGSSPGWARGSWRRIEPSPAAAGRGDDRATLDGQLTSAARRGLPPGR